MESFESFVARVGPPLRLALTATFGPEVGVVAADEALSWAWEHRAKVGELANPVGYLYRVGQTSVRRSQRRLFPRRLAEFRFDEAEAPPDFNPALLPALSRLSPQQRTTVVLVHAFGWTVRETAEALGVGPSSVQVHLERGLCRLRRDLDRPSSRQSDRRPTSTAPNAQPRSSRRNDV